MFVAGQRVEGETFAHFRGYLNFSILPAVPEITVSHYHSSLEGRLKLPEISLLVRHCGLWFCCVSQRYPMSRCQRDH